jgi:hypothetical protein
MKREETRAVHAVRACANVASQPRKVIVTRIVAGLDVARTPIETIETRIEDVLRTSLDGHGRGVRGQDKVMAANEFVYCGTFSGTTRTRPRPGLQDSESRLRSVLVKPLNRQAPGPRLGTGPGTGGAASVLR